MGRGAGHPHGTHHSIREIPEDYKEAQGNSVGIKASEAKLKHLHRVLCSIVIKHPKCNEKRRRDKYLSTHRLR